MALFQEPARAIGGGQFAGPEFPAIRDLVTRLGLAEVAAFGQT
ncbi:MAG TPA: hypothetical protein VED18_03625 [Candidatus Sulfotelmatobacter sp.]|nr:hypothetical protein [Candidatus Sulfotelmatobacter sp.]